MSERFAIRFFSGRPRMGRAESSKSLADDSEVDDETFEERLLNDSRFIDLIADSRKSAAEGRVTRLEDLPEDAR